MERIGIYGGTFNPPHIGHVNAAQYACKALGLTKLLMIPSCISPHKALPEDSASADQRLQMLCLATAGIDGIEVSDLELRRGGTSFTYETVEQVKQQYPDAELVLFMGTDMFLTFEHWREPDKILQNASLGVFYRGDREESSAISTTKEDLEQSGATIYLVENPITAISSTDLRRMLIFRCAAPYLPNGVEDYICRHGLYGTGRNLHQLPMEELEPVVLGLLKPDRVAHVLGCRDTAIELAKHWGADPTDAARAGILHDITKALSGSLQLTLCQQYGTILDKFSTENPKTLHALTGALVARRIFGESEMVVDAIRYHTTGKPDMTLLQKIIYVADYMEPNRDFSGVEELRRLAYSNISQAVKLGLEMTLSMLRQQGREISPASEKALEFLIQAGE